MKNQQIFFLSCLVFLASFLFFSYQISSPNKIYYDETYYIPAAKQFISLDKEAVNLEHPPLAKLIIASSIRLLGDNPYGWRMAGVLVSSLMLVALFNWGIILFNSAFWAGMLIFLSLCNQLIYVQARIAMLDTYMAAFAIIALLFFHLSVVNKKKENTFLLIAAFFAGLSTASKLSGILVIGIFMLVTLIDMLKLKKIDFVKPVKILCVSFLTYALTFLPYFLNKNFNLSLDKFWYLQKYMWSFHSDLNIHHSYESNWYTWAILKRPMWYFYEQYESPNYFFGVDLIGNPPIMWLGLCAVAFLFCSGLLTSFKNKKIELFENHAVGYVLVCYFVLYFSWAIIPRKINFYYYYYPAAILLSIFLVNIMMALSKKGLVWVNYIFTAIVFIAWASFWPITSASLTSTQYLSYLMWFRSWF